MNDVMRKSYRELDQSEKANVETIKELAENLYELLDEIGTSRELSLAKTKLEEAVMWATKHITGPHHEDTGRQQAD